ncbi:hypothetical protein H6504_00460 [Candidatus Woesearchaeota archaeon]|nr:hypothetical protein [Candidatus Woesearchaeota archaeon]
MVKKFINRNSESKFLDDLRRHIDFELTQEDLDIFFQDKYNKKNKLHYSSYSISKHSGKKRRINAPSRELKKVQEYILYKHLYYFPVHKNTYGFIKNKSYVDNAKQHIRKPHVFKTDVEDFFPNIRHERIFSFLVNGFSSKDYDSVFDSNPQLEIRKQRRGYSEKIATLITELVTLDGSLPQGAPTSPALSNLICFPLDYRLSRFAKKGRLTYTRYADDITFSGKYIRKDFISKIKTIIVDECFKINEDKSKFISRKRARIEVTGLVVNTKLSYGRERYRKIKAMLDQCKKNGISSLNKDNNDETGIKNHIDFYQHIIGKIDIFNQIKHYKKHMVLLKILFQINWADYYTKQEDLLESYNKHNHSSFTSTELGEIRKKSIEKLTHKAVLKQEREDKKRDTRRAAYYAKKNKSILEDIKTKLSQQDQLISVYSETLSKEYEDKYNLIEKIQADRLKIQELEKNLEDANKKAKQAEKFNTDLTKILDRVDKNSKTLERLEKQGQKTQDIVTSIDKKIDSIADRLGKNMVSLFDAIKESKEAITKEIKANHISLEKGIEEIHKATQMLVEIQKDKDPDLWERCREKVQKRLSWWKV